MKYLLLILVICGISTNSFAQLTFTAADVHHLLFASGQLSNTDFYSSNNLDGVSLLLDAAGPMQHWDFTTRSYTKEAIANGGDLIAPSGAPLANDADFLGATDVLKTQTAGDRYLYTFFKVDASGGYVLGVVLDNAGTPSKLGVYKPPIQFTKFPLTYQTSWQSSSDIINPSAPAGFTSSEAHDEVVDAYGTIVLPTGSFEALRLVDKKTTSTDFNGNVTTAIVNTYHWITRDNITASIDADMDKVPTSIAYAIPTPARVAISPEDYTGVRISSNPISNTTLLVITLPTAGQTKVALVDALGSNRVELLNTYSASGSVTIPLDVRSISNGTYFLRIESPGLNTMRKVIVLH